MMKNRIIKCPFGLINIGGLVKTKTVSESLEISGAEAVTPLFCHESYKIKTTFNRKLDTSYGIMESDTSHDNGKFYQKKFRRNVLWDFGDGYKEEGYSVQHSYSRPGKFRITCTFYDMNRQAWKNSYFIDVVVKEVIPTKLAFVKEMTKKQVNCSKIERITQLEAFLSNSCHEDLKIQAKRIFSEEEIDGKNQELNRSFDEIPDEIFKFTRRYWTFLESEQQLVFQSDKIYGDKLTPNDLYTPNYNQIYGNFYYDKDDDKNPIKINLYQVIPFKNIDDNLKTIRVLNPNCSIDEIINHEGSEQDYNDKFTLIVEIKQKYVKSQLPLNATPIGKRGFVDIFYKNDYLTEQYDNRFSFYYDIEQHNVTDELANSDNYLNINPLGMTLKVVKNDINKVRVGFSLDGFLHQVDENDDWTKNNYHVDTYLLNSLIRGINLDFYLFPYIEYNTQLINVEGAEIQLELGEDTDFVTNTPMYYVPKDCFISSVKIYDELLDSNGENSEFIGERGVQGELNGLEKWFNRISFKLRDYFSHVVSVCIDNKQIDCLIQKENIINPDEIKIPTEKMEHIDIKELIDTYMIHPMFDETQNAKDFFYNILNGNDLLKYVITKSNNFLNDYANVRTCYLSSLIQMLKMMGEDVLEYERGAFEGVNDLRDFVRILSINHSDLVGKMMEVPHDITVRIDKKGKNVGDEIFVDDVLTLQVSDNKFCKGKVLQIERGGKTYDFSNQWKDGVDIIVHDRYTNQTKIVNFRNVDKAQISILDYEPSWGWNLLLSKKYDDCLYKLKKNKQYANEHNGQDYYSKSELNRIKQVLQDHIRGYYAFYVLNPDVDVVRKGNFLDDATITEQINNPSDWTEKWGITHEILMKIICDNGYLKNDEVIVEDDEIQQIYSRRMIYDDRGYTGIVDQEICTINSQMFSDGLLQNDVTFDNVLKVYGCICGTDEDFFELQFEGLIRNCYDENFKIKSEDDILQFKLKVDENGVIHPTKQVYKLYGDNCHGTLTVSLCGKLKKEKGHLEGFLWDVSVDLFSIK